MPSGNLPPGLHDLTYRPSVDRWGEWEVRFGGERTLQLWAPRVGVSLLLPAPGNVVEISTPNGWHVLTALEGIVRELLRDDCKLELPSRHRMHLAEHWYLRTSQDLELFELAFFRPGF